MYIAYLAGFATVPFALIVPAPSVFARRAALLGGLLFAVSVGLLAAGAYLIVSLTNSYPGMSVVLASVTVFVLSLWVASTPRPKVKRKPPEENEGGSGGGGGGSKRPPQPPKPRGGHTVDWGDFDRLRGEWERQPEPALAG